MRLSSSILLFCICLKSFVFFSKENNRLIYVESYTQIATQEMKQHHIPASIILAQGILESQSGQSELALSSNNHFGIKCHSSWTGPKTYANDDTENECFRVYNIAEESYIDHSKFLIENQRYQSLFSLEPGDYKGWAFGLKQAGYATSPTYAEKIIQIIEELKLYTIDIPNLNSSSQLQINYLTKSPDFQVYKHENKVRYIITQKGDSFYKISKKSKITLSQLHRYNDINSKIDILEEGQLIYLDPKRNHSNCKNEITLQNSMTLREVAQKEAVKLKPLMKRNQNFSPDKQLPSGERIFLR